MIARTFPYIVMKIKGPYKDSKNLDCNPNLMFLQSYEASLGPRLFHIKMQLMTAMVSMCVSHPSSPSHILKS